MSQLLRHQAGARDKPSQAPGECGHVELLAHPQSDRKRAVQTLTS